MECIGSKKNPWIRNGLIKFGNREVVELLKPRMITRKNQWKWIFWDWYNWRMSQPKYKGCPTCFVFIPSFFSLSYMGINSIAWIATIIVCGQIDYKLDSYPTWLYIHLHTMRDERDMFVGLGWEKKIRILGDPHVLLNPPPEHDVGAVNWGSDDYELTLFLQFTQAWRWRMQEKQKQYEKNEKRQADVLEKDIDVIEDDDFNEGKSKDSEKKVKVVGESSRSLSFREKMRGWSPHRRPLKDGMRDKTGFYIDLLRPGPPSSRRDDETSRRLAKQK